MADKVVIYPVTRSVARRFVAEHHSHHDPQVSDRLCLGAFSGDTLVGVSVLASPVSVVLDKAGAWEVTRLCIGRGSPPHTASRLLGATTRTAMSAGVQRIVSYTRVDEKGTSYRAANWVPVAITIGRPHTTGNRALRWLPGMYVPSSEIVNRVRWEYGKGTGPSRCEFVDGRWLEIGRVTTHCGCGDRLIDGACPACQGDAEKRAAEYLRETSGHE